MSESFQDIPRGHFGVILADPPWAFETYSGARVSAYEPQPYRTMSKTEIFNLPVTAVAAENCVLFLWITWPTLEQAMQTISKWGFKYKTCGFAWMKAYADQINMWSDDYPVQMGTGYWTRAHSEVCLLATRGKPKRLNADVRQGIIAPRREHSRKPDGVHERIERLVAGPCLELFARQSRPGWTTWGNETTKFDKASADICEISA